jgi:hypothetical protein
VTDFLDTARARRRNAELSIECQRKQHSTRMVAKEMIEKDLETARQTGAVKIVFLCLIDFQFVKAARDELWEKNP